MKRKKMSCADRARRDAKRERRKAERAAIEANQAALDAAEMARFIGSPCTTCENPVVLRDGSLYCTTCDQFHCADSDGIDRSCTASKPIPGAQHPQICGSLRGHDGPHIWGCAAREVDDDGNPLGCILDEDDPHVDGHEFVGIDAPRCRSLARTSPHGLVFRCELEAGHDELHHAYGGYIMEGEGYRFGGRWEGDGMPTLVARPSDISGDPPNKDGIRYVRGEGAPAECGRCGSERRLVGPLTDGRAGAVWQCGACDETQVDLELPDDFEDGGPMDDPGTWS